MWGPDDSKLGAMRGRLVHGGQEWSLMWAESKWYARSIRGKHHEHMKCQVKERHKERMVQKMVT